MTRHWLRLAALVATFGTALATAQQAVVPQQPLERPAAARADPVREMHHGIEVVDAYRWMEDLASAESQAYFREQAAFTRRQLERLPGREELLKRIRSLSEFSTLVSSVNLTGSRVFYLKVGPGLLSPVLCVRDGFKGAERVLLDPERFSEGGVRATIDWFVASPDARHVAYGVSRGGSEESVLRVLEVASGRDLGVRIDRARFNEGLAWHPDGRSFYFTRLAESDDSRKRFANKRIYRHVLGRETAKDEIVFAAGVGGARDVPEMSTPNLVVPAESNFVYAVVRDGMRREVDVHQAELRDLDAGAPRWKKIVAVRDDVTAIEAWRDDLFLLTHKGASRYRVLGVKAGSPDLAKARVVVPEGDAVIQAIALAKDALYLRSTLGGLDRLERLPVGFFGLKKPEFLKTPFDNHIAQLEADPRRPGAILRLQSWTEAPVVAEVDARTGDLSDTKLQPPPAANFAEMDEVRLYATGHDGAKIPVTLVYKKSTMLTADNPTLLVGYGAYGASMTPTFDPTLLAWLERGGIFAIAHLRGGGEYGEEWHRAGFKAKKENTVLDFIAVAEFISRYGFTSARRLAILGTSAGGIPSGGALVRRPELFAAVITRGAMLDMLRAEFAPDGSAQVPEFGSIASKDGFDALRAMSSYHQVKEGAAYPAVLLTAGMNDARVEPWHAGKMAARLQSAGAPGKPVLLRADFAAGAGRGTTRRQREEELADIYSFLFWQFGHPDFQPPAPPPPPAPPAPAPPAPPAAKPVEAPTLPPGFPQ